MWMVVATIVGGAGCSGEAATHDGTSRDSGSEAPSSGTPAPGTVSPDESTLPDRILDPAAAAGELRLDDADWAKTWRRLTAPSVSKYGARVAGVPGLWIAVSSRDQDGTKAPPPLVSFVYLSQDGTHWRAIPVGTEEDPLQSADIAYGGGRYVMAGMRNGGTVVLDSTDGETWREQTLGGVAGGLAAPTLRYAHDRFFCMNISFWSSSDGEHWVEPQHAYPFALFGDIAYGNGLYLGVGAGTQVSSNGIEWHATPPACDLPGACIREPLHGELLEDSFSQALFAEGTFHMSQGLTLEGELRSSNGEAWQYATGPYPDAYVGGHFVKVLEGQPRVWLDESSEPRPLEVIDGPSTAATVVSEPVPVDIDDSWGDGVDCTNARCVLIRSRLYLVP
jgi:hypothetical protein